MQRLSIVFILFMNLTSFSQTRLLKGKVIDSLNQPMQFANIMAKPLNNSPFVFAITEEEGVFEMKLQNKTAYVVTVSFMGYCPYTFKIDSLQKPEFKTIILKPVRQDLDEVIINYQTPVKITKDSIVYDVKHFVRGDEHKLKAVLNKLPGVKVDENGQITVMGKRIMKVMVEGKDFFGGNSKLAVDNIPADAVKSIQVLKDYNRISFMKGLTDEQKTVINIKLREGKKRFVFGDLLAGGNKQKKYLLKTNLFYYSPYTNLSYIGNLNNMGEASLNYQDIIRLENKKSFFMSNISYSDDRKNLVGFAGKNNFVNKKTLFNALQWQQDFGSKWEFQMYSILANEKTNYQKCFENQFLIDSEIFQLKTDDEYNNNRTGLTKINLIFEPKSNQYYDLSISVNKTFQDILKNRISQSGVSNNSFVNKLKGNNLNYFQSFLFYKKISKKHIIRFFLNYKHREFFPIETWTANQIFLSNYIDWQSNDYTLLQNKNLMRNNWSSLLKYYFKINNHNHLYFSLGDIYTDSSFKTGLSQVTDNHSHSFTDFTNDYHLNINDFYGGLQYRFKIGKNLFTPGIYAHYLQWNNFENNSIKNEYLFLPELNYEGRLLGGDIEFRYAIKTNLPDTEQYAQNKILKSYDKIAQGNINLTYELFHQIDFHYGFFSMRKGVMFFTHLNFRKYLSVLKQKHLIMSTNFYSFPEISHKPEYGLNIMNRFVKEWQKWYVEVEPLMSVGESYDFINNQWISSNNIMLSNSVSVGMDYKNFPELKVGVMGSCMNGRSQIKNVKYQEIKPFVKIKYSYKNFTIKADFKLQYINENSRLINTNKLLNFSLFYRKEDKPFGVEVEIKNLLNQEHIYLHNTSSYMISNRYVYIQPRIWMFKLHYKL